MGTNSRPVGPWVRALAEELRAELGRHNDLTQRALSDRSSVPYATLSKSLNAKRQIDLDELGRICSGLRVAPSEIFRRAESVVTHEHPPWPLDDGRKGRTPKARGGERNRRR